ncbi:hypothetical protein DFQ27_001713 [Actinomortierella ambigua]|uniref:Uncharacterized protein n=1 Tax=Actinomortierella ambigua TaxID=1343610 RepID=A0A9P6QN82_9FUNG|nr:hypothetical protein DFQ26_009834 [Actinomortierella ambigua]KAG0269869.1 hypothetical protein DFQ27_001713 [Actinomortierella ambigua]
MPAMMTSYSSFPTSTTTPYCKQQQSQPQPESLLFTPPLSPTEEQLLAFLIPDIDPRELAAYLSNPSSPTVSTDVVSGLLIDTKASSSSSSSSSGAYLLSPSSEYHSSSLGKTDVELAPYPSPVCQAAAATVVAFDRLDAVHSSYNLIQSRKRCSTYAFDDEDEDDQILFHPNNTNINEDQSMMMMNDSYHRHHHHDDDAMSSCSFVMSSQNTRKRLLLEQAFVSPDEDLLDDPSLASFPSTPATTMITNSSMIEQDDGYAHLFDGAASVADQDVSVVPSMDLSSPIAFDLVLV